MRFCKMILLAFLFTLLTTMTAYAQYQWGTGMHMMNPACQSSPYGGDARMDKEDIKDAKLMKKKAEMLAKEIKKLDRDIRKNRDTRDYIDPEYDEYSYMGYVDDIVDDIKDGIDPDSSFLADIAVNSFLNNLGCNKDESDSKIEVECGPSRNNFRCKDFSTESSILELSDELIEAYSSPNYKVDCGRISDPDAIARCREAEKRAGSDFTAIELEDFIESQTVVASNTDVANAQKVCNTPQIVCNIAPEKGNIEGTKKCREAVSKFRDNLETIELIYEHDYALGLLEGYEEELADIDFYTEGQFCAECYYSGSRRFVDDRSDNRRIFDTMLPILGATAATYAGWDLHKDAVRAARDLGYTTNPSSSFLSYGWPMMLGGVMGGVAAGVGHGGFFCAPNMAGGMPGGYGGMINPMTGLPMGGGMWGNPYAGFGGNFGYGIPLGNIIGFPVGSGPFGGGFGGGFGGPMGGAMMGMPMGGGFGGGFGMPYGGGFGGSIGAGFGGPGGSAAWMRQQQMQMQWQMQQQQQYYQWLMAQQQQEAARMRLRSELSMKMQELQMQMMQLEYGGFGGGFGGGIGAGFGAGFGVGIGGAFPSSGAIYPGAPQGGSGWNPARGPTP